MKYVHKLATISFSAIAIAVAAQAQNVTTIDFDDADNTADYCYNLDGGVREFIDDDAEYGEMLVAFREAETPIRTYVSQSLGSTEIGISRALVHFGKYYTHQIEQQNERELENQQVAQLIGQVLPQVLNAALPGSGAIVSAIRTGGQRVYQAVVDQAPAGTTSPEPYLNDIAERFKNAEQDRQLFTTDMFNNIQDGPLRDQVEAVKFEYVMEGIRARASRSTTGGMQTAGQCTGELLSQMGIPRGGSRNADNVHRATLELLIKEYLCLRQRGRPEWNCETGGEWQARYYGRTLARRLIRVNGDMSKVANLPADLLPQICPLESTDWRQSYPDCDRWRQRQRSR